MATRPRISRVSFILAVMVVSLALTALLAWQALDAASSHRAIAEEVLRDYAALAADEYIRRTASHVAANGYFPLLGALGEWVRAHGTLPSVEQVGSGLPERAARAPDLVRALFSLPLSEPGAVLYGGTDPDVERWLRETLAERGGELSEVGRGLPVLHETVGGRERTFVCARISGAEETVVGFEVDRAALGDWFSESFESAPLLPPSLAQGEERRVFIRAVDGAGEVIFRSAESPEYYLAVYRPFGDTYSSIFDGMRVVASVDPSAAATLVIGGLPKTRLPLLLGLITLTFALLIAAVLLLRRERALTQLRSEFVSRVSHELRTPLAQIRLFAETLFLDRVRSQEERRRALTIIDRESRRLTRLVENVLQFSRGERGSASLTARPQELSALVQGLVKDFRPLVEEESVELKTELEELVVPVDEDALRQILLNLLDNAVKYGPASQVILVETRRDNGAAIVSVDDQGPGVPAEDRERIWKRFRRLDRAQEASSAGTGIGLAVVRELAALHGGRSWVETGTRGGARFVVELPMAPDAAESR